MLPHRHIILPGPALHLVFRLTHRSLGYQSRASRLTLPEMALQRYANELFDHAGPSSGPIYDQLEQQWQGLIAEDSR